jgi:hypothetical protein
MKKTIGQMAGELLLVAVGVYLGIVSSNYNEERKEVRRQGEFLQTLALEIAANKQKLQRALAYREKIFSTTTLLRKRLPPDTLRARFWAVGGFQLIEGWQGVTIPSLEKSVYESGLITNTLSGLDFKTINAIAQVYSSQEEYKELARLFITDKIIGMDEEITTQQMLNTMQWWWDVISIERDLSKKYQVALTQLKQKQQ